MTSVSLFDAKTHLSRLVEDLVSGKQHQVVISRHGKPVVRMEPIHTPDTSKRIGLARGRFKVPDDIDKSNPLVAALFTGGRGGQ